ncbi:MAG: TetR/AcrR family transcriptional regulator [Deltaproteobacteria bacterium]|nr:MAG: TetR/AcrR family transcriptional regulator [Deltaproteobacteria bacterium]
MTLKEKIIQESSRLFSSKGFSGTSINEILEAAGASKGGLYNHFKTKEELFSAVLSESRKIWREKNLAGLDEIESPIKKIKKLLENYRDRYLIDSGNLPGGCIFVRVSVESAEIGDQWPHLAKEINEGFDRLKFMVKGFLDQAKNGGQLRNETNTEDTADMIFSGMLGASVRYGMDKSIVNLNRTINSLIEYIGSLAL